MTDYWSEVLVVPDGAKIEIRGPFTILATTPVPPKPEPISSFLPRGSFFPKGPGWWNYPGDEAWPWLQEHGYTWGQFNSMAYDPRKRPWPLDSVKYVCEIQTIASRPWDWPGSAELQRRIDAHAQSPALLGMGLNIEVPHRMETGQVKAYLDFAKIPVLGGPLHNDPARILPQGQGWDYLNAGMTWINCWHWDRMWRDVYYAIAEMPRTGIPWALSVQPCVREGNPADGTPIVLAPAEDFRKALQVATDYADGIVLWKVEQLWMADQDELGYRHPSGEFVGATDTLEGILGAIKTVKPQPRSMPELPVYFRASDSARFNLSRMLCRVVSRAGYVPVNQAEKAGGVLTPGLMRGQWTADDKWVYDRFHQLKHTDRDGTEREKLIEIERRLADWVKANYGGE